MFLCGAPAPDDRVTAPDDFDVDYYEFEEQIWPVMAERVPAFDAIKLVRAWAGHYDYNTLDQNAIVGPHPDIGNFLFLNGFSGHGLQQSPAMGRGTAEWLIHGEFRSLDLSPFRYDRIPAGTPYLETAVI